MRTGLLCQSTNGTIINVCHKARLRVELCVCGLIISLEVFSTEWEAFWEVWILQDLQACEILGSQPCKHNLKVCLRTVSTVAEAVEAATELLLKPIARIVLPSKLVKARRRHWCCEVCLLLVTRVLCFVGGTTL